MVSRKPVIARKGLFFALLLVLAIFSQPGEMVKQEDFKQCAQSAFCVRQRAYADLTDTGSTTPYELVAGSLEVESEQGIVTASLIDTKRNIPFSFTVNVLERNTARVVIKEARPLAPRYELTGDLALDEKYPKSVPIDNVKHDGKGVTTVKFGENALVVRSKPFSFELRVGGVPAISFNDKGYLYYEHWRQKEATGEVLENEAAEAEGAVPEPESGSEKEKKIRELEKALKKDLWEESFNGKVDSKPHGPASIGFDLSFPGSKNVYGIPQHASSFSLKSTRGPNKEYDEPYRMYNLDVFEYTMDSPMALYGSIPFMMSHKKGATAGVYWLNAAEMWVDVETHGGHDGVLSKAAEYLPFGKGKFANSTTTSTHWMSESGVLDLFVFLGTKPTDIFDSFTALTGRPTMPQHFAIAYHQCRWNYMDEQDVSDVDASFDKYDIPYDVLWLDIEHTDGKRYFTWDKVKFANPVAMQENLAGKGRKMVTIIDPHIKRDDDYYINKEFKDKGMFIKDKDGKDFDGWCWPGSSNWIDYTDEKARALWASKFAYDQYKGSTPSLYTWNDMNEPSVFSGPETTMPKDALHVGGVEHRDVHNVYGTLFHRSTFQGHLDRNDGRDRPFILSRAFFAGTQRYGAIWTGDNFAQWSHLEASVPMLLTIGASGVVFGGADVGGFFGNPEPDLLLRWYQVAAFQPFFRAHAHIDTKRREPWLFGEPYTGLIRSAIRERYKIMPYLYTLFEQSTRSGIPIMRAMVSEFPEDEASFSIGDQFMLGSGILVKPVVSKDQQSVDVYLPASTIWYDYVTLEKASPSSSTGIITVKTPLEKIPIFLRGGSIIPRRERVRRSSSLMLRDPYTLWVVLDPEGKASGHLYADDGHSYDFCNGAYILSEFTYADGTLTARAINKPDLDSDAIKALGSRIERVVIVGLKVPAERALLDGKHERMVESKKTGPLYTSTVRDPAAYLGESWELKIV
ncbi:hypothetical protein PhCBS80983_g02653 [Powellomyces hirtus]|uniref:Glucosidase II subunit alpha n=1 Tax=Powellomyces hirtus TaxID=109895 RepID=A0A507E7S1_9FUNG|nr:hypothetical protein PhCBS80983_g02653 [Powellomyces hirtus]